MRDRLEEELAVQNLRTLQQQERLAKRQADLEPWKLVVATAAVFGVVGAGIGGSIVAAILGGG